MNITLDNVGTYVGTWAALAAAIYAVLRWRLLTEFAQKSDVAGIASSGDVEAIELRLERLESRVANVPSHEDVRRLEERVRQVEVGVADVRGDTRATREIVARVERQVGMLVAHQLDAEKRGGHAQ